MEQEWVSFFSVVAGATAAIFALTFVAMQTRHRVWTQNRLSVYAVAFTLAELAAPMFVSLIAIIPGHPWRIGVAIVATIGLALVIGQVVLTAIANLVEWLPDRRRWNTAQAVLSLVISGSVFGVLTASWVLGQIALAGWLCVWLVTSGITESFLILLIGSADSDKS
ncbi:hypothetical protein QNM97_13635 [Gordonia sp. L191]|uniref:hypothetical protein n=1 Tax=Gordonia sp. L191 TaxID=2982699 RepID=UPI0024C060CD|nr:hypothetical protein [Gordonia sp. L191]WHU45092.1 hypothetical protein QNM97_13635 [Gordonia sp. L191]